MPRPQLMRPPRGRSTWQFPFALLPLIERHLGNKSDDSNTRDSKVIVFVASVIVALCGLLMGIVYVYLQAYLACAFPFCMFVLSCFSIFHMFRNHDVEVARRILYSSVCLCPVAIHLSFGGRSGGVVNWALFAPQLVIFTGGNLRVGVGLLIVSILTLACSSITAYFVDPHLITFQPPLSNGWYLVFSTVNGILPWLFSFLLACFTLGRLRNQNKLEEDVVKAETLAQMIIDFDLEAFQTPERQDGNLIVNLLQQVAYNLRLYRPYIPPHLLPHSHRSSVDSLPSVVAPDEPISLHTVSEGQAASFSAEPMVPKVPEEVNAVHRPRSPRNLRAPARQFDVVHELRTGTLLYIHFHHLDPYASYSKHPAKVELIRRSADVFTEIVTSVLKETNGVIQTMQHGACLASWNFIANCRMHSINACHAAVLIRDRLHAAELDQELAPLVVSMGLWSGSLISGTFGTQDFKSSGTVGAGMAQVVDLQHYAATHQRTIVANAEVRNMTSSNPNIRLLAVDVITMDDPSAPPSPYVPLGTAEHTEIIYEVVGELAITNEEWMYQLQSLSDEGGQDKVVERLWRKAQVGVSDGVAFQRDVASLVIYGDDAIVGVAMQLEKLAQGSTLALPYCTTFSKQWSSLTSASPVCTSVLPILPHKPICRLSPVESECSLDPSACESNLRCPASSMHISISSQTYGQRTHSGTTQRSGMVTFSSGGDVALTSRDP